MPASSWAVDSELVARACEDRRIIWRKHALERMLERQISREDVLAVLRNGDLIREYIDDRPFASALWMGMASGRPIHVVAALDRGGPTVYIVTAYEPTMEEFEQDLKTRRVR